MYVEYFQCHKLLQIFTGFSNYVSFGGYAAYFGIMCIIGFRIILEKLLENLERLHCISTTHFDLTDYI